MARLMNMTKYPYFDANDQVPRHGIVMKYQLGSNVEQVTELDELFPTQRHTALNFKKDELDDLFSHKPSQKPKITYSHEHCLELDILTRIPLNLEWLEEF
jgi:hypothetical protein